MPARERTVSVNTEKTNDPVETAFEPQPQVDPQPEGERYVQYVGNSTLRIIDKQGWLAAGVDDQDEVVWSVDNEYKVPASELSEKAIAYCQKDGRFLNSVG